MMLMTEEIDRDSGDQRGASDYQWSVMSHFAGPQRAGSGGILKVLETNAGSVSGSAAIGFGGVGGSYASIDFNSESLNFINVNIARAVSTWSWSSPGARGELSSLNQHRPFGVQLENIGPSDRELIYWVGNYDSFIGESDFGMRKEDVDAGQYEYCNEGAGCFSCDATLVETRPDEESAHHHPDSSKDQVGPGTIDFNIGHSSILSHHSRKACDSVKAVR